MNFNEAYQKMLEGKKVKRPDWKGYWFIENDKVKIKFAGGEIKENRFTQQTIKNTAANDWEVYEEPKSKVWKPEKGDEYYYITSFACIDSLHNNKDVVDDDIYSIGNCFKTKEEAQHMAKKLKIIAKMRNFIAERGKIESHIIKTRYEITYNTVLKEIRVGVVQGYVTSPLNLYFNSNQDAEECIALIGKEKLKKYYFDIED